MKMIVKNIQGSMDYWYFVNAPNTKIKNIIECAMSIFSPWQHRSFESSISHGGRASELCYLLVIISFIISL